MKATVLVDNIPMNDVSGEWGLSIYIEYNDKRILLDTGASDLYLENAQKLSVDITKVDYGVLSHGHYDHSNGMRSFFENNKKASFYLQDACRENCYFKKWFLSRYIGIPKNILEDYPDRVTFVSGKYQLDEGIFILSHSTEGLSKIGRQEMMYQKKNGRWYPDDFSHEQSLVFKTDKGLVIFNSCSHGGAANIIREVADAFPDDNVYALIGGFHLFRRPEKDIRNLAKDIKETGIEYVCTGHCTKERAFGILKQELGDSLHQLHVGMVMEF